MALNTVNCETRTILETPVIDAHYDIQGAGII